MAGPVHLLQLTASELVARLEATMLERDHAVLSATATFKVGWDSATSVVERERDAWEQIRRERAGRGHHIHADTAHVVVDALERLLGRLRQASPAGLVTAPGSASGTVDTTGEIAAAARARLEADVQ